MPAPNFIDKLTAALPPVTRQALDALTRAARDRSLALYAVGGCVRDLLLERPTLDLDLTLEGDAPALARAVAAALPDVRCTVHPTFRTATLKGSAFRIDVATARAESYARSGALPTVRPGSLRDDLFRRDFTANALALALTSVRPGDLIDPFNGAADLEAGRLRVLHGASFRDDATRILRGARYEARLGFRFEPQTLRWLRRDVRYLATISGRRLRDELLRALHEPEPERVLLRLQELGVLAAVHPPLAFDKRRATAFARLRELRHDPPATARLALLAWDLTPSEAAAFAARLSLTRRETEAVRAAPDAKALLPALSAEVPPSRIVELLSPLPIAAVWALAAAADAPVGERAEHYLNRWRHARSLLDGHALQALGVPPGPRLGEVLRRLKAAKLDGEVRTRRDEERLARQLLSGLKAAETARPRSS
jgi:tRNA nucleotidyltransferase (CCA-adding enzyme)